MRRTLVFLSLATLFLAASGFDCASTEMTTAKVALQHKDYQKAEEALKKEVGLRPTNSQAWLMLGDLYEQQGRYVDMSNAYDKALAGTPALTETEKMGVQLNRYRGHASAFNRAYLSFRDKKYSEALLRLDTADMIRAGNSEVLWLRGTVLTSMNDEAGAAKVYQRYVELMQPTVSEGTKLGLTLGMTPAQLQNKMGQPTRMKYVTGESKTDTVAAYAFYAPQNLYVYFSPNSKTGGYSAVGWKFYRDDTPEPIREITMPIELDPYETLAMSAYEAGRTGNKARYSEALGYLQTLEQLDPRRTDLGAFIANIYVATERTAEARAAYEAQIRDNPKDPATYIAYGNLLFRMQEYGSAAENFRHVIDLGLPTSDENYGIALYNLGAVYKNWGVKIQDSINKVANGKPLSPAQLEALRKPLRESVRYFEQFRSAKSGDYAVVIELANLYDVLGDKGKLNQAIKDLEGMKVDDASQGSYWRAMSRLYAIIGDKDKAESADRKATQLGH